ncbi:MAG: DegT/DnrJ/EryC1/StrS family aminotransferase [Alloprevotella sp.]|nr:DegT/DnrJ/EryC1/StrS family aminotransferase [Alloprevotella sp.]
MITYYDLKEIVCHYEPSLSQAISRVVASGRYLNGPELQAFEQRFASYVGATYCVGVANGLDALTLILRAYKIIYNWDNDREIILPAMTFAATALSVVRAGLVPVFCDISPIDLLLDSTKITDKITDRTCALLPVHLYGRCCNMAPLRKLAKTHNLLILEDAAQAHGVKDIDGQTAGNLGDAAAFSFYPGKNLGALGDGGCVTTNDLKVATLVRTLANYGAPEKYQHKYEGINSRLDEIQAAVLNVRLDYLTEENTRRKALYQYLTDRVDNPLLFFPHRESQDNVCHIIPLLTEYRDELRKHLLDNGIETQVHYPVPLHKQPVFSKYAKENFPIAEQVAEQEVSLPINPYLTETQMSQIASLLNQFKP